MSSRPDELLLLDLVERDSLDGDLEQPLGSGAVRDRTQKGPRSLSTEQRELVKGMRRDREVLRSVPTPPLPMDFVEAMTDLLAPPAPAMAGLTRAQGWRRGLRLILPGADRWSVSMPALAGLGLAASLGAALATAALLSLGHGWKSGESSSSGDRLAGAMAQPSPGSAAGGGGGQVGPLAAGGTPIPSEIDLHHLRPPSGAAEDAGALARGGTQGNPGDTLAPIAGGQALGAGTVALVIRADGVDPGLSALQQAIRGTSPNDAALVRNVTYREAFELDARIRAAEGSDTRPPAMTSGDARLPRAVGPATRSPQSSGQSSGQSSDQSSAPSLRDATLGEHLAGPRHAATTPELQLELAEDGFSYSVTLPVERLRDLLIALAFDESVRIQLGSRKALAADQRSASAAVAASSAEAWRRWQEASTALSAIERGVPAGTRVTVAVRIDSWSEDGKRRAR